MIEIDWEACWGQYPEMDEKIKQICQILGLKLKKESITDYQYDGQYLYVKDADYSGVIHDLAHFIVCSPNRRHLPDFGLGTSPNSNKESNIVEYSADSIRTFIVAQEEEETASVLGIAIEAYLNLDFKPTLVIHSWAAKENFELFWKTIAKLNDLGYLCGHIPTLMEKFDEQTGNI